MGISMKKTEIIKIKTGKIQGYIENGLKIFKGIPYAEAPIGDLRFENPIEKKPWDRILDTTKYGSCCFQGYSLLQKYLGKLEPESEDCLNLNIWTPNIDNEKRAVMLFIHGGAFFFGGGTDPAYDGSALANRGNVVVVTINYRLGAFGFLYLPEIPINVGLLDQVLALKFVRDNIKFFGGDPDNITIFGESAGGYSVISLCGMPTARGLFNRAIAQSAPFINTIKSQRISKKIIKKLEIKRGNIEELHKISPEKILNAQNNVFNQDPTNLMALRPLIDGDILPDHPLKAFQNGDCKDIDFMIGTNLDESKLFTAIDPRMRDIRGESAKKLINGYLMMMMGIETDKSEQIIETYIKAREGKFPTEYKEIFSAILTDIIFGVNTTRLLNAQSQHQPNTYNYLFAHTSPLLNGIFGSCHALELPFVFGNYSASKWHQFVGKGPEIEILSEKIMDAWIAFAYKGNPNHLDLIDWPAYDKENKACMILDNKCEVGNAIFDKEKSAWNGLFKI